MKKLPRGLTVRGPSIIASFALQDGTIGRRRVGLLGITSPQECVRKRLEFIRQVELGTYQPPVARVQVKHFTMADLWAVYLREYENRGGKNSSRLAIAWNHLKPMFERMRVENLTTDAVSRFVESRRADGVGPGTINRETSLLIAMFHHGQRVTPPMVDRVPAFPRKLKEPPPRKGFIENEQYAALAKNAKPLWLRALIACAYSFGFRRSELLNLRVGQVDLMERSIELYEGETKSGDGRKVFMTGEVFELMRASVAGKKPNDYVFTREDGSRVYDPRDEWYSLCVVSDLGKWIPAIRRNGEKFLAYRGLNLHDFRRSAIRNMTRRGVGETVAMRISGHKTASVFRRYNIVDERDLQHAASLIEAGSVSKTNTKTDTQGFGQVTAFRNSLN